MDGGFSYDRDSGQVFKEWVEKRLSLDDIDWHRRQPFPLSSGAGGIGQKGARSLMDMCITLVGNNIADINNDTVQELPDSLLWRVWDYLDSPTRGFSFHAWKLFVKRLGNEKHPRRKDKPLLGARYTRELALPKAPLSYYINPMISPSCDFLVHLTIGGGVSFEVNEMLSLPDLVNLTVLEIVRPDSGQYVDVFPRVSDRVVREWSKRPNPFPALRALHIFGDDLTSYKSLQYVAKFPVLTVYDVGGKLVDWSPDEAQHPSWQRGVKPWVVDKTSREPIASISLGHRTVSTTMHSFESIDWTFTRPEPKQIEHAEMIGGQDSRLHGVGDNSLGDMEKGIPEPSTSRASKRGVETDRLTRKKLKGVKDLLSDFGL